MGSSERSSTAGVWGLEARLAVRLCCACGRSLAPSPPPIAVIGPGAMAARTPAGSNRQSSGNVPPGVPGASALDRSSDRWWAPGAAASPNAADQTGPNITRSVDANGASLAQRNGTIAKVRSHSPELGSFPFSRRRALCTEEVGTGGKAGGQQRLRFRVPFGL